MPERSSDWLRQAVRDLESARIQMEHEFHEWACFIAQQAAEKAIKAVYQKLAGESWGHSVSDLLKGLGEKTSVPPDLIKKGKKLDRFYIPARYPNGWASGVPADYFTGEDAHDAISDSEEIIRFCKSILAGQ